MRFRATRATPAGVPRSRSSLTRRERLAGCVGRCMTCRRATRHLIGTACFWECFPCNFRRNPPDDEDYWNDHDEDGERSECEECDGEAQGKVLYPARFPLMRGGNGPSGLRPGCVGAIRKAGEA